jgi:hypothetical protein
MPVQSLPAGCVRRHAQLVSHSAEGQPRGPWRRLTKTVSGRDRPSKRWGSGPWGQRLRRSQRSIDKEQHAGAARCRPVRPGAWSLPSGVIMWSASTAPYDSGSPGWCVPRFRSRRILPITSEPSSISFVTTTSPSVQHYQNSTTRP